MKLEKEIQDQITFQANPHGEGCWVYKDQVVCLESRRKGDEWPDYALERVQTIDREVAEFERDQATRPMWTGLAFVRRGNSFNGCGWGHSISLVHNPEHPHFIGDKESEEACLLRNIGASRGAEGLKACCPCEILFPEGEFPERDTTGMHCESGAGVTYLEPGIYGSRITLEKVTLKGRFKGDRQAQEKVIDGFFRVYGGEKKNA